MKINKAIETMSSRERVLRTFHFEKTDRVPIDYIANPSIHNKLSKVLGVEENNYEGLLRKLGVDYRGVGVPYRGPSLFSKVKGLNTDPVYGFNTRWVKNGFGGYEDFCAFPLENVEEEVIANFPVPNVEDFDYSNVVEKLKTYDEYSIYIGGAGFADIINSTGRVMGMEQTLINLLLEDEATLTYINRKAQMELGVLERLLNKGRGRIDFLWMGEDLGTQHTPLIGLDLYRKVLKPIHKQYVDLAKSYNIPVMMHSCGSSSWAYKEFIEIGINAVDTLQPEATNMKPKYLKDTFGNQLSFHGCISTAGPLAYGTTDEVRNNIRETLEIMMPGGGYHLAPTHAIQDNTPVENLIAMYQAAHELGEFR
ncbi:MAG: uroporphyrinogen decarboxylase family protein [Cellulosilyticaceae bacterium]